jgi:hypothetical protein
MFGLGAINACQADTILTADMPNTGGSVKR